MNIYCDIIILQFIVLVQHKMAEKEPIPTIELFDIKMPADKSPIPDIKINMDETVNSLDSGNYNLLEDENITGNNNILNNIDEQQNIGEEDIDILLADDDFKKRKYCGWFDNYDMSGIYYNISLLIISGILFALTEISKKYWNDVKIRNMELWKWFIILCNGSRNLYCRNNN